MNVISVMFFKTRKIVFVKFVFVLTEFALIDISSGIFNYFEIFSTMAFVLIESGAAKNYYYHALVIG